MNLGDVGQRLRAPLVAGPYNSPGEPDWDAAVLSDPISCELQPLSSDEVVADAQRVEGRWTLFLGPEVDLLPTDRWVQAGLTYEVDGQPEGWRVRGEAHHQEARLKLVTGG